MIDVARSPTHVRTTLATNKVAKIFSWMEKHAASPFNSLYIQQCSNKWFFVACFIVPLCRNFHLLKKIVYLLATWVKTI